MAARKTTTVVEENAPDDDVTKLIYTDDDDTASAEVDALEGMISEFSGSADTVVNVYRQGDGKSLSFLFRTHPGEMTGGEIMEQCRDHYGTGNYRVHIRQGPRLVANKPFSVEAKKVPDEDERDRRNNSDTQMLAFITAQMNNQQQMFAETMRAMAEAFKGNQSSTPQFDPVAAQASLMQQLVSLKQISEPKDESKGAIEMFIQGITLAKELAPKEGETNTADILLKGLEYFAPTIAEATKQAQHNRQISDQQKPGFSQPQNGEANADAQREQEMGMRNLVLKQQLSFLIAQAKSGKDPELYAELLLDQVGEERVLEFVGQPDAMQKLIALNPEVKNVQVWFDRLRYAILDLTNDDGAGDDNDTDAAPAEGEIITKAETDALSESTDTRNAGGNSERPTGDTPNS